MLINPYVQKSTNYRKHHYTTYSPNLLSCYRCILTSKGCSLLVPTWPLLFHLYQIIESASANHKLAKSFANPNLNRRITSSPFVLADISLLQSHPLLAFTLPSAPLPPLRDRCSLLATSELPAFIMLPPPTEVLRRSAGVDPFSPGADASTTCKNSSHAVYTLLPTACRSSMALRMISIWSRLMTGSADWP